jgi:aspartate/methionine/tyrosine aminotransferase
MKFIFTYDGDVHYSVMNIPGEENAIMIDSVSKRYSMCGKNWLYCFKKQELMLR